MAASEAGDDEKDGAGAEKEELAGAGAPIEGPKEVGE
eukprot:CAMPEP_0118887780 /NCGR_PEP_ID=MMETSP1163-20130328/25363_1 /TAXON_ID=124430 /ORGANISM="Phaeomonas parva, Strain CCMP2877" /LENGTH=36 /DNA_ID= /DNA_START= /DNA_END= /DNA_ORIENTATION=